MSSSAAPSSLPRILLGSLIGAAIGLILLALGLAILWKAAEPRPAAPEPVAAAAVAAAPVVAPSEDDAMAKRRALRAQLRGANR